MGAALRFLFAAMSAKKVKDFPFQGIPQMLYMDNGPIARSGVFQKVMGYLGVEVRTHMPQGSDGRRVTARAKGKVERPLGKFLTIPDNRGQNCRAPCIVLIPKIWMGGSFDTKIIGLHPRSSIRLSGFV